MSVRKSNSNKMSKPFCKVCFDTGKNPELFSSHFIKNVPGPKGIIVCPTLLALSCLKCNNRGHTISYCTFTEIKKPKTVKTVVENSRSRNSFSVLDTRKPRNKPAFVAPVPVPVPVPVPAPVPVVEPVEPKVTYASITKSVKNIQVTKTPNEIKPKAKFTMRNWADVESDDD